MNARVFIDSLSSHNCNLLFSTGNSVVGNETEVDSAVNVTSLSTGDEKIEEVSQFTSLSSSLDPTHTGRKFRDEEAGSGMLEEVFSPTPGTPTSSEGATTTLASPDNSLDSAETELLPVNTSFVKEHVISFEEEEEQETEEEVRQQVPTLPSWQDAKGDMETTVFDLDHETSPTTPSPTHPPSPSPSDVTVDFFDSGSRRTNLGRPTLSTHELQGRDPTSWSMPENYDYMTPYDDSVSPTTDDYPYSSTTDSYDDDISTTPPSKRFPPRLPSNPVFTLPKGATVGEGPRAPPGVVDSVNGSECRQGFVRTNGSCKSPCDLQPNYCFNGGQCYVMEGTQMFCRITIKGAVCNFLPVLKHKNTIICFSKYRPSSEHHNDNFSLSTIAEGSHPNVRKLCDTPPNLPHARALAYYDNIICQDDPNTQNKLEDPVKAPPPKEDESLNIQNSLTPKHENHKVLGEENSSEVNSLQNNMM
uniref:Chondroitin sulfate proteoglycan 5a n=1 Tax=Sinocyclocheilus grahami TaxID=75366 RepID=A0A672KIU3_SINGR